MPRDNANLLDIERAVRLILEFTVEMDQTAFWVISRHNLQFFTSLWLSVKLSSVFHPYFETPIRPYRGD